MEYYVFENLETAITAEQWICDKASDYGMGFKQNPDDVTERYATPIERLDGKGIFPRLPENIRSKLNESDIVEYMTQFTPTTEEYSDDWINTEEEYE